MNLLFVPQVEVHFKHETFMALNYAQGIGTVVKQSLKRVTKWAAKYYVNTSKQVVKFFVTYLGSMTEALQSLINRTNRPVVCQTFHVTNG